MTRTKSSLTAFNIDDSFNVYTKENLESALPSQVTFHVALEVNFKTLITAFQIYLFTIKLRIVEIYMTCLHVTMVAAVYFVITSLIRQIGLWFSVID